jgi:hypothetical protein
VRPGRYHIASPWYGELEWAEHESATTSRMSTAGLGRVKTFGGAETGDDRLTNAEKGSIWHVFAIARLEATLWLTRAAVSDLEVPKVRARRCPSLTPGPPQ